MMTSSKQMNFTFNSLLEDIRGSECCVIKVRQYISFSDLFSVCLRTIHHLILKLWIFSGHTASFKIEILKVQDFGNFELSPMC